MRGSHTAKDGGPDLSQSTGNQAESRSSAEPPSAREQIGLYGAWNADPTRLGVRPRCLHLFSGKRR